jgi:biotin carboxyl carrier protein
MKIYKIKVNKKTYIVELESVEEKASTTTPTVETKTEKAAPKATGEGQQVLSPIQGNIVDVRVKVGDRVEKGDVLLIIEAMKLENEVPSAFEGEVAEILVTKGQTVSAKEVLLVIK